VGVGHDIGGGQAAGEGDGAQLVKEGAAEEGGVGGRADVETLGLKEGRVVEQ
jgi:hypothetical protein